MQEQDYAGFYRKIVRKLAGFLQYVDVTYDTPVHEYTLAMMLITALPSVVD